MERKFESVSREPGFMQAASEIFMANLPILICVLAVGVMLVLEMV
jgi:hypothetical protein